MRRALHLGILAFSLLVTVGTSANQSSSPDSTGLVVYLGLLYCEYTQYCPDFAYWGTTPPGYVELTKADGTPSYYLWVDIAGQMTFECSPLTVPPPAGLPLLGHLVADGTLQEVDQFFPAGWHRPLFIQANLGR